MKKNFSVFLSKVQENYGKDFDRVLLCVGGPFDRGMVFLIDGDGMGEAFHSPSISLSRERFWVFDSTLSREHWVQVPEDNTIIVISYPENEVYIERMITFPELREMISFDAKSLEIKDFMNWVVNNQVEGVVRDETFDERDARINS